MRLTESEKTAIVMAVRDEDPEAQIYLFGSRTRDDLKGGDIDLLVISDVITFTRKLNILVKIKAVIGDQKIDLKITSSNGKSTDPFVRNVLESAVQLRE